MRIAFHNRYEALNPALFVMHNAPIGDDLLLPFVRVKEEAQRRGHIVGALDTLDDADAIVFIDVPMAGSPADAMMRHARQPKYLITFENAMILRENFNDWSLFRRVLTWADDAIRWSPDRVRKINYAQDFESIVPGQHDHFCAIVCSNKWSPSVVSLYGERLRAIQWFERNAPGSLDLFGPGWQKSAHPSWRGFIPPGEKRKALASYRFAIVFENLSAPGYITEKIFDAFIAGTVPVYLGAPNVESYIPRSCFVDARDFIDAGAVNVAAMYDRLLSMDDDKVNAYVSSARAWMQSQDSIPFRIETFAKTVIDTVTEG